MKISNLKVYDLEESIIASGYPMMVDLDGIETSIKEMKDFLGMNIYRIFYENQYKLDGIEIQDNFAVVTINNESEKHLFKIDFIDLPLYLQYNWSVSNNGYLKCKDGMFHRMIMDNELDDELVIDHIDRDKSNNTRSNLRVCTRQENSFNCNVSKNNTSGIVGVSFRADKSKWRAYITINNKQRNLGHFKTKDEAIVARLMAEKHLIGDFAPQSHLFEQYGIYTDKAIINSKVLSLSNCLKHFIRMVSLGTTEKGSGHDQALTGIRVAFDLTFSNKAWVEAERYRFLEFVRSQSTMHRITRLDIRKCCNKYVWGSTIKNLEEAVAKYNAIENKGSEEAKELYLEILYNVPSGFELTARLTTNYRAIKTIYDQRKNHRLPEWREFCEYMKNNLPLFKEIVLGE